MERIELYAALIGENIKRIESAALIQVRGSRMRVVLPTRHGNAEVLLQFYEQTLDVLLRHKTYVPRYCRHEISERLLELNRYLDKNTIYAIGKSDDRLIFDATYELREKNPKMDDGLDGFCTLLFKTAPVRLDDVADLVHRLVEAEENRIARKKERAKEVMPG